MIKNYRCFSQRNGHPLETMHSDLGAGAQSVPCSEASSSSKAVILSLAAQAPGSSAKPRPHPSQVKSLGVGHEYFYYVSRWFPLRTTHCVDVIFNGGSQCPTPLPQEVVLC